MGDCGDQTDKDGKVRIAWGGQTVVTLKGAKARTFLARADGADAEALQLLLARMVGNFKRGNERAAARKGR